MKLFMSVLLSISLLSGIFNINNNETGHRDFSEIIIDEDDDIYLLINTSLSYRKKALNNVKWRLFGPSVYVSINKARVGYKKNDVFSRSNKTSNVIEYDFKYTTTTKIKISSDFTRKNTVDVSAKISQFGGSIEESISNALGIANEVGYSKEVDYTITINPYSKVTMYITGEALLSQGAVKYYFFGIPIYKSNWECIDIVSEFYELYEESYK